MDKFNFRPVPSTSPIDGRELAEYLALIWAIESSVMGKRKWYSVYGWDDIAQHHILLAKIRTQGLAHLTAEFYRTYYTDVRVE